MNLGYFGNKVISRKYVILPLITMEAIISMSENEDIYLVKLQM